MNWQCRLYGHHWRHPGQFEIVIVEDSPPAHPFECARCGDERLVSAIAADREDSATHGATGADQESGGPLDPEDDLAV